jgi:hypothetical protein
MQCVEHVLDEGAIAEPREADTRRGLYRRVLVGQQLSQERDVTHASNDREEARRIEAAPPKSG